MDPATPGATPDQTASIAPERGGRTASFAIGLAIAAVLAYANTFSAPFVLDDIASIVENASIRRLWPLASSLAPPADAGVGGRPLSNLTFALNYAVGGLHVQGYHAVNLAIHIAAGLTLAGLVRRTLRLPSVAPRVRGDAGIIAFAAALLWLLHPLQTEAVTYVSQRTESLMALLYLSTLYCFLRYVARPSARWIAAGFAACGLGMATKEVMVTAPVIVLLYDRTFVAGSFRAAFAQRGRFHLLLGSTWLILAFLLIDVGRRGVGYAHVTWWQYAMTECGALLHYLRLTFLPTPLVFDYGSVFVRDFAAAWPAVCGALALLGVTLVLLWKAPAFGFAAAWVLVLLAPTSSVVPVAAQPIAEHRMYLPLAAIAVGVALALARMPGRGALIGGLLLGSCLGFATFARNADYQSALALWTDTVLKRPDNPRAHAALGEAQVARRDLPRAVAAFERALQLDPDYAEAHNNLATVLIDLQRTEEAVTHFTASLGLRPGTASTHYNLGNALLSLGRADEAVAQQQRALALRPDLSEARCALADALLAAKRTDEAIASYRRALAGRPDLVAAHYGLANALALTGQLQEARVHYEATLRVVPNATEARYNLGNLLMATGRPAEALSHYEVVVQLKPDFAEAHNNLANAYALTGRVAEAMAHYETALRLMPGLTEAQTNLRTLRSQPEARRPR